MEIIQKIKYTNAANLYGMAYRVYQIMDFLRFCENESRLKARKYISITHEIQRNSSLAKVRTPVLCR
jgi:hypothetical protein